MFSEKKTKVKLGFLENWRIRDYVERRIALSFVASLTYSFSVRAPSFAQDSMLFISKIAAKSW